MSSSAHARRSQRVSAAGTDAMPSAGELSAGALAQRIADVTLADGYVLRKRLTKARRMPEHLRRRELEKLADRVARAERRIEARRAAIPELRFPAELPVSARVADLAAAIRDHQVVVVAGETGSGKSTQLPKICLQLGRGITGTIGHTQPRRLAARTLAERIAQETSTVVGATVGYAIRFDDHTNPRTLVKLMTDGILLAEIQADPELRQYDTIIIDEAHERSLNIDFLLGYLARLLPRRPDLKLIITSATIDPGKFSEHFSGAPIVEVSGRTYPVEIRYTPTISGADSDDADEGGDAQRTDALDQPTAIRRAVDELLSAGDGDILVFLSGEREITDTADGLRAHLARRGGMAATIEVLPLYGRLSMADQHKVFAPSGRRRIVLATNVAETSLTVPGIRYVIDPGTARISRYSPRTKVQRLPIEKISQASAGQRAGRCGRVADGICIRLYSADDFEARPEHTDPEIARTSLASVILRMAALGLGEIETFPFVDPPDTKLITDGMTVLAELGALDTSGRGRQNRRGPVKLTEIGRMLAALPVDPRLARILVEGDRQGCLGEVLVIVSALAIRDVREYPVEERDKATACHARFADDTSDFVALVNLWHYLRRQGKELSGNQFRKMCKAEYVHFLRVREWQDLHAQLRRAVSELGMDPGAHTAAPVARPSDRHGHGRTANRGAAGGAHAADGPAGGGRGSLAVEVDRESVHLALLAGLLSHIGSRKEHDPKDASRDRSGRHRRPTREYHGTRGSTFMIWPGSSLAKANAPFVVAAELVETSRLFARTAAAIDPAWIERVGGSLLRRQHSGPYFSTSRNAVMASETVMVLGVTIASGRVVAYDSVDPVVARELLIRRGLVDGQLTLTLPFLRANKDTLDEVSESERRARRRDIAIDDEALFELYDERIPADVTSGARLEAWWRKESRANPRLLIFTPDLLISADAKLASPTDYPDRLDASGLPLDLEYVFEPGAAEDGVSATVPLAALASIDPRALPTQVPGLRRELALALIKSLPKRLRRSLVPAPDFADAALGRIGRDISALPDRLAAELSTLGGITIAAADFDYDAVPGHLRMRFTVVGDDGETVAVGTDLASMQRSLRSDVRRAVAQTAPAVERAGLTEFPVEGLDRVTSGAATPSGAAATSVAAATSGAAPALGAARSASSPPGSVTGYPAFVDDDTSVSVRMFTDPADQARAMMGGIRRFVALECRDQIAALETVVRQRGSAQSPPAPDAAHRLGRRQIMTLATAPHGAMSALIADAADAAIDALLPWAGGVAWTQVEFQQRRQRIAGQLETAVMDILVATADVLAADAKAQDAIESLARSATTAHATDTVAELRAERDSWLGSTFITTVQAAHLPDVARYLAAIGIRADRFREHPDRDRVRTGEIADLCRAFAHQLAEIRPERSADDDVHGVRRLIAEYRIALFAQPMRTAVPVSAKRIRSAIAALQY